MWQRIAHTLKFKAEVLSLCWVIFVPQTGALAKDVVWQRLAVSQKTEMWPSLLRLEETGTENRAGRGQTCFSFCTNTGDRGSLRKGKSSVRIKQVLFNNCFWLPKTLNSYKNSRVKFLMQWKYQTVKLNNSSLPPAFRTQYLFCTWRYEHTTHTLIYSALSTCSTLKWSN